MYAIRVIAALLFAGRDSDVDGRWPVLAACVGFSALSSILFLLANGLALLLSRGWCRDSRPGWSAPCWPPSTWPR